MFIEVRETPNPDSLKLVPGIIVVENAIVFKKNGNDDYSQSTLVKNLFTIDGVEEVFLAKDFIAITKNSEYSWNAIKTLVIAEIMDHFMSGLPTINDIKPTTKKEIEAAAEKSQSEVKIEDSIENQIIREIKELLHTRVDPAVAQDGGRIAFKRYDHQSGIVYLSLQGACSGCPSSSVTLKQGIERMLQHFIPEIKSVEEES